MIKKAVYSQWSKPFGNVYGGFLNDKVAKASWEMSVRNARMTFGEVDLVCDAASKSALVDELGLEFDNVYNVLDDALSNIDKSFWVMGKFWAYKMQTAPFIHIDSDFIFFDKVPKQILESDFVFSNKETVHSLYKIGFDLLDKCPVKPWYYDRNACYNDICCVGVIGANNLETIKEWVDGVFEIVTHPDNKLFWRAVGGKGRFYVCWVLEQYLIANLLKKKKAKMMFLEEHFYRWAHFLGGSKRDQHFGKKILGRNYFDKIVNSKNTKGGEPPYPK